MNNDSYSRFAKKVLIAVGIITAAAVFLLKIDAIASALKAFINAISPLCVGALIAFILNVPMKKIEALINSRFGEEKPKWVRGVSVAITYFLAILIVVLVVSFMLPQLWDSLLMLVNKLPGYLNSIVDTLNNLFDRFNLDYHITLSITTEQINDLLYQIEDLMDNSLTDWLSSMGLNLLSGVGSVASAVVNGFVDVVLGVVFSVYVLMAKEKFKKQCKNLLNAFLPKKIVDGIAYLFNRTNNIFSDFITGQITEMLILGSIYFVVLSIA